MGVGRYRTPEQIHFDRSAGDQEAHTELLLEIRDALVALEAGNRHRFFCLTCCAVGVVGTLVVLWFRST